VDKNIHQCSPMHEIKSYLVTFDTLLFTNPFAMLHLRQF